VLLLTALKYFPILHGIWVLFWFDLWRFEFCIYHHTFFKWEDFGSLLLQRKRLEFVFLFLFVVFIEAQFVLAGGHSVVLTTAGGAKRSSSCLLVPERSTVSVFLIIYVVTWEGRPLAFGASVDFFINVDLRIDFDESFLCAFWNIMGGGAITVTMKSLFSFKRLMLRADQQVVTVSVFVAEPFDRIMIGTENDGWLRALDHCMLSWQCH